MRNKIGKTILTKTAFNLGINYSTAKTLMRKFKNTGEDMNYDVLRGISDWFENYSIQR